MVIFTSPSHAVPDFRKFFLNNQILELTFFLVKNITILKTYLIPVVTMEFMGNSTSVQKPGFLPEQPFTWTPNHFGQKEYILSIKTKWNRRHHSQTGQ